MPNSVCPFSGEDQTITYNDDLRNPGFVTSGGFDPSLPFLGREDGMLAFRRRHGKEDGVSAPMCPYTGRAVAFVKVKNLWYARGEFFNPMKPCKDKDSLEYQLYMRQGRPNKAFPKTKPKARVRVRDLTTEHADPTEGMAGSSIDDTKHIVGELLDAK